MKKILITTGGSGGHVIPAKIIQEHLSNNFEIETIPTLLISLIFVLFGVLGDLFESRIKRSLDVKDSSHFLPGHGGVLDRVDSQILSFPVLVLFIQFLDLI